LKLEGSVKQKYHQINLKYLDRYPLTTEYF
jgi:hypothetical protein